MYSSEITMEGYMSWNLEDGVLRITIYIILFYFYFKLLFVYELLSNLCGSLVCFWVSVFVLFELLCQFSIFKEISNESINNKIYCESRNDEKVKRFEYWFNGEGVIKRQVFAWPMSVWIQLLKLIAFIKFICY